MSPTSSVSTASSLRVRLGLLGLAAALLLAYANSFRVPPLFDDVITIEHNASIQHLWPLGPVLSPPPDVYSGGRPLLNLSFALNYAAGGTTVTGYHAVNWLIHLLSAAVLFALLRRVLLLPRLSGRFGGDASGLALLIAALWALHPVQTEAVTYLSQRAESLMGLCYLATAYGFVRGATAENGRGWFRFATLCCLLGIATKETMVTAPVLLLAFDRTFLADSFRTIWRERRRAYAGLFASWLLLAYLMLSSGIAHRISAAHEFTPWTYLLTECRVLFSYVRVAVWPQNLVFDYGLLDRQVAPLDNVPYALVLAGLFAAAVAGWWRGRAWGFLGLAFFILLAPTSSVVPIQVEPMAESRLYLPLVLGCAALVLGLYQMLGRWSWTWLVLLAGGLAFATHNRNHDYRSSRAIWEDTLAKQPANARAHNILGFILLQEYADRDAALVQFRAALALQPDYALGHYNLAAVLSADPAHQAEAAEHYEITLRLDPKNALAHNNLAILLSSRPGREQEVIAHYEAALRLKPDDASMHNNLAVCLVRQPGRRDEAITHFEASLRIQPENAYAHYNLATILVTLPGRTGEAIAHFEAALRINPALTPAREALQRLSGEHR